MKKRTPPTLQQLAESIAKWQARTFPQATGASASEHLRREADELHEHYWDVRFGAAGGRRQSAREEPKGTIEERAEEAADMFFMLVQLAQCDGFDLRDAVASKYKKNLARDWQEPDAQGVVEHVRGSA